MSSFSFTFVGIPGIQLSRVQGSFASPRWIFSSGLGGRLSWHPGGPHQCSRLRASPASALVPHWRASGLLALPRRADSRQPYQINFQPLNASALGPRRSNRLPEAPESNQLCGSKALARVSAVRVRCARGLPSHSLFNFNHLTLKYMLYRC